MSGTVVRRLFNLSASRALLVVAAAVLLVLPITQGYLAAFVITACVVLIAAFVGRPAWIRLVLAALGSFYVMVGVASVPNAERVWERGCPEFRGTSVAAL